MFWPIPALGLLLNVEGLGILYAGHGHLNFHRWDSIPVPTEGNRAGRN